MQREFTALLDPPAVESAPTLAASPALPEIEAPRRADREPAPESASPPPPRPASKPRPRRVVVETEMEPRASAPPPARGEGPQYGPVRRDETLLSIARQVNRDPSATPEQMTIALYRANPHAFYKNSVNALKSGEILRIPPREAVLSVSDQEARVKLYGSAAGARRPENIEAQAQAGGGQETRGQLQLLAPPEARAKAEGAGGKAADAVREELDTVRQQNEEMSRRLGDLEKQLMSMQKLLTLKDEQIASIQAQQQKPSAPAASQAAPKAPETAPIPAPPAVEAPPPKAAPPLQSAPEPAPKIPEPSIEARPAAPVLEAPPPAAPPAQAVAPPAPTLPAQAVAPPAPALPPETPPPAPEAKVAPAVAPPPQQPAPPVSRPPKPAEAPAPKPPQQPLEESGFLEVLFGDPTYLISGVGGLLLLGAVIWAVKRRRASMIDDEMESILTMASPGIAEKALEGQSSLLMGSPSPPDSEAHAATRSSFLSEFTPSDFDALGNDAEEVDPISEADVYLAYGRYKQAEELIRGAIAQHPEREECKLKLLEIHYATENLQAFESYARELLPLYRDSNPDFWEKVVEMGREICPDSPIFSAEEHYDISLDEAELAARPQAAETDTFDLDDALLPDLNIPAKPLAEAPARPQARAVAEDEADNYLDFMGLDDLLKMQATPAPEESGDQAMDFDNMIAFDSPGLKPKAGEPQDQSIDDFLAELESARRELSAPSPSEASKETGNEIEFDLGGLSKPPAPPPASAPTLELRKEEAEDEYGDLYSSLTDMDEHETKLDLAKAYVDMGDEASARDILENVIRKGNEQQRLEAKTWLDRISGNAVSLVKT
jgi:pilus assembly protein FimV